MVAWGKDPFRRAPPALDSTPNVILFKLLNATNENSMVFEDSVAGIQAANIASMTSIGIGDERILHEAKYNFKDFTFMDTSFIGAFIN